MKLCKHCGENKPLTEFFNSKDAKDGKQAKCKQCTKIINSLNNCKPLEEVMKRPVHRFEKPENEPFSYKKHILIPICEYFRIGIRDVLQNRNKRCTEIKIIMYLTLRDMGLSLNRIGSIVDKNHASVLNLINKATEDLKMHQKYLQLKLFAEFDEKLYREIEIKKKGLRVTKEVYNTIDFTIRDAKASEQRRILNVANALEISWNEAQERINSLLAIKSVNIPNYSTSTTMRIIA